MKEKEKEKWLLHLQGRDIEAKDIALIKALLKKHPSWSRTPLSRELCQIWDWYNHAGHLKDMSCRLLLRKLERLGYIQLPPAQHDGNNAYRDKCIQSLLHCKEPITGELKELYPLKIQLIDCGSRTEYELKLFKYFISMYHYLGWSGSMGENIKYLVLDNKQRPLACLMFGAAAWKVMPRDRFIGWAREPELRKRNLSLIANNNRFLILPWVQCKCLASHILAGVCRQISQDWQRKYNHPLYLLETFVESKRFSGTCYKAANWIYLGQTQGRGRYDVKKEYALPVKSIWVYPLRRDFRTQLCGGKVANGECKV